MIRTSIAVGRNTGITCGDVAIPMRVIRTGGEDGLADCVSEDGETDQLLDRLEVQSEVRAVCGARACCPPRFFGSPPDPHG